eukprot:349609_1
MTLLLSLVMCFALTNADHPIASIIKSYQEEIKKQLPYHAFLPQKAEEVLKGESDWVKGLQTLVPSSTNIIEISGTAVKLYSGGTETEIKVKIDDSWNTFLIESTPSELKANTETMLTKWVSTIKQKLGEWVGSNGEVKYSDLVNDLKKETGDNAKELVKLVIGAVNDA